jgi:hypothetical protein
MTGIRLVGKNQRVARAEMRKFCDAVDAGRPPSEGMLRSVSESFHRILEKGESADVAFGLKGRTRGASGGRPKGGYSSAEMQLDRPAFERIDELHRSGISIKEACNIVWLEFPDGPRSTELRRRYRLWTSQREIVQEIIRSPFARLLEQHSRFAELLRSIGLEDTIPKPTDDNDAE